MSQVTHYLISTIIDQIFIYRYRWYHRFCATVNTVLTAVQYALILIMGTVSMGTGVVSKMPTQGLPVSSHSTCIHRICNGAVWQVMGTVWCNVTVWPVLHPMYTFILCVWFAWFQCKPVTYHCIFYCAWPDFKPWAGLSQARPKSQPDDSFGLACNSGKPTPSAQATAF